MTSASLIATANAMRESASAVLMKANYRLPDQAADCERRAALLMDGAAALEAEAFSIIRRERRNVALSEVGQLYPMERAA